MEITFKDMGWTLKEAMEKTKCGDVVRCYYQPEVDVQFLMRTNERSFVDLGTGTILYEYDFTDEPEYPKYFALVNATVVIG